MYLITRRDFLKYCSVAAGALGLSASSIMKIEQALADQADTGPNLLWVSGASCSGCITSLLNTIFYADIRTVLLDVADLVFQETVQAACGATLDGTSITNEALENTRSAIAGNPSTSPYVLLVEGGVPTAKPKTGTGLTLGNVGEFCDVGPLVGGATPSTMYDQVRALASSANCAAVLSIGTCSAFGGIPAARGSVIGQKSVTGALAMTPAITTPVVNIPGCPPHPDWIVGTILSYVAGGLSAVPVNRDGCPTDYFGEYQCNAGPCVWRYNNNNRSAVSRNDAVDANYPEGNSKGLGKNKWTDVDVGCMLSSAAKAGRQRLTVRPVNGMPQKRGPMVLTGA